MLERSQRCYDLNNAKEMGMNNEDIKFIEPVIELKAEFLAMIEEFEAEDRDTIDGIGCIEADDFEDSVRRAKEQRNRCVVSTCLKVGCRPVHTGLFAMGFLLGPVIYATSLMNFWKTTAGILDILCVHRNKTRVTGRKYFDWHWKKRGA
jgi:hypothetical protein